MLKENAEIHKQTKAYLTAWSEGKRGKLCKIAYGQCSMNRDSIDNFIGSDNQWSLQLNSNSLTSKYKHNVIRHNELEERAL